MERQRYIDLHTHTNYSDAIFHSPQMLVVTAAYRGIDILAKTDHDTVLGIEETKKETDRFGMTLIPGVEITTPIYHILGYNFEKTERFLRFLDRSKKLQEEACGMRTEILRKSGVPITLEKVLRMFPESRIGKHNILFTMIGDEECKEYLTKVDPEKSPYEIFKYYFGNKGIASNMPNRPGVSFQEAINEIHLAGGVAGIAHPAKDIKNMSEMEILLANGLDFMEHQTLDTKSDYSDLLEFAKKNKLPVTYGSDYHGPTFLRKPLGREKNVLTREVAEMLKLTWK
jgi:predicted metal-dependent phosphoesterase TrpH